MMDKRDVDAITRAVLSVMREGFEQFSARIAAIESNVAARLRAIEDTVGEFSVKEGPPGPPGPPGKDGASSDVEAIATLAAALALPNIPEPVAGKDGAPGRDGKDADPKEVALALAELLPKPEQLVNRVLSALPPIRDGKDGAPGKDAPPVDVAGLVAEILELIPPAKDGKDADEDAIVTRVLAKIPTPKDGQNGKDADLEVIAGYVRAAVAEGLPALVDEDRVVSHVLSLIPTPSDGRSVTPEECRGVIVEEISRAVSELPKPKDGLPGPAGRDGESVHPDTIHMMIRRALDEIPRPRDGKDGKDGKDGEPVHPDTVALAVHYEIEKAIAKIPVPPPGRDALQLEILPAIDPMKIYPARTYAKHNGGVWVSLRATKPGEVVDLAEWDCVLDSITSVEMAQSETDPRCFTWNVVRASGKSESRSFKIPFPLYVGAYKNGTVYGRGDQVTRDGNQWTVVVDSTDTVPGFSPDWQLSVRKGESPKEPRDSKPNGQPKPPISLR